MNRIFETSALVLAVLGVGVTAPIRANDTMTADERAVRAVEQREVKAILDQDAAALEQLLSENYTVNNPQNGITPNRAGVIDRVKRGLIRYSSFERHIEVIRFSGDIAIVMGSETVVPIGEAPRAGRTVHRRYTNIWKKSGATWYAIARHANVIGEQ